MKKITLLLSISVVIMAANNNLIAQDTKAALAFNEKTGDLTNPKPDRNAAILDVSEVSIKAVRDFTKKFKGASAVSWVKNGEVTSVYFTKDDIKMRSTYDKKGRWEYSLQYYDEFKLPNDLRQLVKSTYYDMSIILVTEVKRRDQTFYLVKMEDKTAFVTILIHEMEIREFDRVEKN